MIYSLLKSITRLSLKVYFRKIHIKGLENIPEGGPFMIVANHPSSFLDPACIAVLIKQKINFLAKGSMFNNKIISKMLTGLNMIPVYRAQDDPKILHKNHEVFKGCFDKLGQNGVIMIFPEGTSEHERKLRQIKTGAARIALGAVKENNYNLNVKILPVGLNYTKSSRFRSEIFIQFGTVLETDNYVENYKKDEIKSAKNLTEDIETSIKRLIIDIDKDGLEALAEKVESLYKKELFTKSVTPNEFEKIKISQDIYSAIKYFQKKDVTLFNEAKSKIDDYFSNLKAMGISDKSMEADNVQGNIFLYLIKRLIILTLGFPIWLFGFVNSFIPYKLPRVIALKITNSEAFYGALLMAIGTVSFTLFYSLATYLTWHFSHSFLLTICYAIALPLSGFFTIFYARIARGMFYNLRFYTRFFNKKKMMTQLISERTQIIFLLEQLKSDYQKSH
jgi:glycerol-3-phosphate O-acyltransferase/dihydroxyacetone phosphate acyltransferase